MPKKLSEYYNLTQSSIISYDQSSDIIESLQNNLEHKPDFQLIRNEIWEKNCKFISKLIEFN